MGTTAVITWPRVDAIIEFAGRRVPLASFALGTLVLAVGWSAMLRITGSRDPRYLGQGSEEYRRVIVASVVTIVAYATVGFFADVTVARLPALGLPIGGLALLAWRLGARRWVVRRRQHGDLLTRVALLGSPADGLLEKASSGTVLAAGIRVVAALQPDPNQERDVASIAEQAGEADSDLLVLLPNAGYSAQETRHLHWSLEDRGIGLAISPSVSDVASHRLPLRTIDGLPLLYIEPPQLTGTARAAKRAFDLCFSAIAVVLAAIPMLAIAALIRLDSRGPALFAQRRVGKDGRFFTCYKFRTMRPNADVERDALRGSADSDGAAFKIQRDPRVTRVGRLLRRFSLDELPQLFNVLRGNMSIVGPRPHPEDDVARYTRTEHRRLLVKPGLTGLWQVSGRSDLPWERAVQLDLRYVENWTFTDDLFLLAKTLRAVISGKGAY